jgi:hypothetical protein
MKTNVSFYNTGSLRLSQSDSKLIHTNKVVNLEQCTIITIVDNADSEIKSDI